MARLPPSRLAKDRARSTPPASGETIQRSFPANSLKYSAMIGGREQIVHRQVEKTLNLAGVQVDGQQAIHAGHGQEIGNELGADRCAGNHLAVLAGIAEVGHHGRDALGAGAL